MSVFFNEIGPDNPVKKGDAEALLEKHLGVELDPKESVDYYELLAAVHDCAEHLLSLPDYQPVSDQQRYPRENVHRPAEDSKVFGAAWAHKVLIRGAQDTGNGAARHLAGKSVCIKDCIAVAGVPQFYGSDAFDPWTPVTDATVVTRVLDAGADILGTATCEHFCNSTASFTSAQGTVENPHATGYSAGGSTSGGAALVAGKITDIAIGTDQGGSIRVPSALCGCVGMKPTYGLVPFTGITSGDAIDDHAGPLARSVLDVAKCLDALAGYDGIDDRSVGAGKHNSFGFAEALVSNSETAKPLSGIKVGILAEGFNQDIIHQDVRAVVRAAIEKFEELGATVEEVSVPEHLDGPAVPRTPRSLSHRVRGGSAPVDHGIFPATLPLYKNTVINGLYLADKFPGLYGRTVNIGRRIRDAYEKVFTGVDVLVLPTTPFVARRHGMRDSPRASFEPTIGMTTNTAVFNVTGHPAMSIPVGWAPATDDATLSLPVGMQIVGALGQDKKVLQVGHAWESSFDWVEKR
ncbi:unnamed protein product [Parascedosporium putredinis]|uniref:Amidase domain-containing protein n=1 Tax=Parascedosporium putredinis TaxID=1442378 RepID=A0A9P1M984_9PEZI|nr:unnamed protein product [Parascedosporium putredinis]CAI7990317.1 unnamed protein product [Parascedosporium putredinis]